MEKGYNLELTKKLWNNNKPINQVKHSLLQQSIVFMQVNGVIIDILTDSGAIVL